MKKYQIQHLLFFVAYFVGITISIGTSGQKFSDQVLWKQGTGKYNNYRMPSVIVTQKGTILAFCEGREAGDTGDIDILLKRSEDNGKTWSDEMVVWDDGRHIDYPHVMEYDGHLYVAFAGSVKQKVEVIKIRISDLDDLDMSQLTAN